MLYTPSHAELAQHPKTRKLARLLQCSIPTAIGHLNLLWHFALKYAPDGDLSRFDSAEIADGCMWEGTPETLCEAFESCEWVDRVDEWKCTIHDWHEYGGKALRHIERLKGRASTDYKEWRQAVLERDAHTCQECGNTDDLKAHHILRYATHPKERLAVWNGVTLCGECHRALHSREGYR